MGSCNYLCRSGLGVGLAPIFEQSKDESLQVIATAACSSSRRECKWTEANNCSFSSSSPSSSLGAYCKHWKTGKVGRIYWKDQENHFGIKWVLGESVQFILGIVSHRSSFLLNNIYIFQNEIQVEYWQYKNTNIHLTVSLLWWWICSCKQRKGKKERTVPAGVNEMLVIIFPLLLASFVSQQVSWLCCLPVLDGACDLCLFRLLSGFAFVQNVKNRVGPRVPSRRCR